MTLLILGVGLVCFLGFAGGRDGLRHAALIALTIVSAIVLVSSEVLSLFRALTTGGVFAVWLLSGVAAAVLARRRLRAGSEAVLHAVTGRAWSAGDWLIAGLLLVFAGGTLAAGLLYPPENYDSLTAHLPSVFFWIENRSIAHYPTSFGPQIFSGNLVSYFATHLELLSGRSDRLIEITQWLSYLGCIAAVSLLARRLGARMRGEQVAALATAATPMALLQASTTQTDLTTALWCVVAVYALLGVMQTASTSRNAAAWWSVWAGVSIGLAVQSKASAYLVCAPFVVMAIVTLTRRAGVRRALSLTTVALACLIALNAGHYARNARLFGADIIGSRAPGMAHILVRDMSPRAVVTNGLKNASLLLGSPSGRVNDAVASAVRGIVATYGGEIEQQGNQEEASGPYHLDGRIANHDVAPAPLTVLLVVVSLLAIALPEDTGASTDAEAPERHGLEAATRTEAAGQPDGVTTTRGIAGYVASALVAMALTAGLVSWNLFVNRVLLAPLLLLVPLVGVASARPIRGWKRLPAVAIAVLLALSAGWGLFVLAFNSTNRLVSPSVVRALPFQRDLGYWNTAYDDLRFRVLTPELERPFREVASAIERSGAQRVGIHDEVGHFPVYPLLWLLRGHEVGYVDDVILGDRFGPQTIHPQAVVEILPATASPETIAAESTRGRLIAGPLRTEQYVMLVYTQARPTTGN